MGGAVLCMFQGCQVAELVQNRHLDLAPLLAAVAVDYRRNEELK